MLAVWLNLINEENPNVQNASISAGALLVVLPLLILYCFVQKRFVQGAALKAVLRRLSLQKTVYKNSKTRYHLDKRILKVGY